MALKKVKVKLTLNLDVKTDINDEEMLSQDILEAAKEHLEAMSDEGENLEQGEHFEIEENEEEDEED